MTEDTTNPSKPFLSMRWLISGLVSTSVICGSIAAVAVLFFADGLFDVGKDPASSPERMQRFEARMAALEKRVEHTPQPDTAVRDSLNALQKEVDALETQTQQSKAGQIVLALTQIKDAYDHDQPMRLGLELLQKTVTDTDLLKKVDELSALASNTIPTRAGLMEEARGLFASSPKPADLSQNDGSWLGRAKGFVGQFIQVQPLIGGASYEGGGGILQALSQDDLPMARSLASQLPVSPGVQNLLAKIETRLRAQSLVQQLISSATHLVGNSNEGLY